MTEARLESKGPTSLEEESMAEHVEVSTDETALKKQHWNRHLAIAHRKKQKEQTQGKGGSRKKLAATRRGMTHRARVARRKGHSSGTWQEQCCKRNLEKTIVREETPAETGMQQWYTGPRPQTVIYDCNGMFLVGSLILDWMRGTGHKKSRPWS
jgi:hypothetical protein